MKNAASEKYNLRLVADFITAKKEAVEEVRKFFKALAQTLHGMDIESMLLPPDYDLEEWTMLWSFTWYDEEEDEEGASCDDAEDLGDDEDDDDWDDDGWDDDDWDDDDDSDKELEYDEKEKLLQDEDSDDDQENDYDEEDEDFSKIDGNLKAKVGCVIWNAEEDNSIEPVVSVFAMVSGGRKSARWLAVRKIYKACSNARIYFDSEEWTVDEVEIARFPLNRDLSVDNIARTILETAKLVRSVVYGE